MRARGTSDDGEASSNPPPPPPPPPPRGSSTPPLPPTNRQNTAPSPPTHRQNTAPSPRQQQQQQQQQEQLPAGLPPPPPPPPPPLPNQPPPPPAICNQSWVLKLRHPGKGILKIHVSKGMTAYLLSKCIIQATDVDDDTVVGLFAYNTGMFVSLEYLLSCTESLPEEESQSLQKQLYSLHIPAEPRSSVPIPWWQDWQILMGGFIGLLALLWLQQPLILQMISAIPRAIENLWNNLAYIVPVMYHGLVTRPLKDTYRYGPSFMGGWEGASLTNICARMTYGDEEFWKRNLHDCENMYHAKESAFLFVGRPLVFLVLLLAFVWIVKQWLWYHELQQRDRYQDRDMVQTYRAMQVLFRQVYRMTGTGDTRVRRPRDDYHN